MVWYCLINHDFHKQIKQALQFSPCRTYYTDTSYLMLLDDVLNAFNRLHFTFAICL